MVAYSYLNICGVKNFVILGRIVWNDCWLFISLKQARFNSKISINIHKIRRHHIQEDGKFCITIYFKIMNYRTNRRRRLGKPLKRLLDQTDTGLSVPESWCLMMISIFQIKVTNEVTHVLQRASTSYAISHHGMTYNGKGR